MKSFRPLLFLLSSLLLSFSTSAQELKLIFHRTDADSSVFFEAKESANSQAEMKAVAYAHIQTLRNEGYAAASLDSFSYRKNRLHVYYYRGEKYSIQAFEISEMSRQECRKAGIRKRKIRGKAYNEALIRELSEKIVFYYAQHGYPFCKTVPKIEFSEKAGVSVAFEVYKQEPVSLNSVYIKGSLKSSDNFVKNYLNIHSGDLYNEKRFRDISSKISELNFIREIRAPAVEFYDNKADVYLYLENQPANRFSGILGLANDSLKGNALSLTGDLNAELYDSFKQGEFIALQWNRIEAQAQLLDIHIRYPYPWSLPLEPSLSFLLNKTDSAYLSFKFTGGTDYIFPNGNRLIMNASSMKSSVLSRYESTEIKTVSHVIFSAGYEARKLDYVYNPASGYAFKALFGTGNRKFDTDTKSLYTGAFDFDLYFPLYKKLIMKTGLSHRSLFSGQAFYRNELYKFGGNKTMRGFDEQAFEALNFTVFTAEMRLLYDKDAALYFFSDLAYYTDIENQGNFLAGFGPGVNISTKAGIFSLSYALGKRKDSPLKLADSKIHVAYVNRF
jgi:outer membrane protein assembly factor BamA